MHSIGQTINYTYLLVSCCFLLFFAGSCSCRFVNCSLIIDHEMSSVLAMCHECSRSVNYRVLDTTVSTKFFFLETVCQTLNLQVSLVLLLLQLLCGTVCRTMSYAQLLLLILFKDKKHLNTASLHLSE